MWQFVNSQWRSNGFGVIGLDYSSLTALAEINGIDITPAILEKIQSLEHYEIKRLNKR